MFELTRIFLFDFISEFQFAPRLFHIDLILNIFPLEKLFPIYWNKTRISEKREQKKSKQFCLKFNEEDVFMYSSLY